VTPERLTAPSGLPAERVAARDERGGVVLIPFAENVDEVARGWSLRLASVGFTVVLPVLGWRAESTDLSDTEVIGDLAAARDLLPRSRPRFVVGLGGNGLYARMAACAVLGLTGAVDLGGRISYPGVSARRPIQPLDLLPGLSCGLQCHFATRDPGTPAAQVDDLERRLATARWPTQVLRYPGREPGFLDPRLPAWNAENAASAQARTLSFLHHLAAGAA
jgi:dienelactone hydrolase